MDIRTCYVTPALSSRTRCSRGSTNDLLIRALLLDNWRVLSSKLRGFYYYYLYFLFFTVTSCARRRRMSSSRILAEMLKFVKYESSIWAVRTRFILTSFSTFGDYHQLCTRMIQLFRKSWNIQKKVWSTEDTKSNGIPRPIWNSKFGT